MAWLTSAGQTSKIEEYVCDRQSLDGIANIETRNHII